jgi:hypothetical protein
MAMGPTLEVGFNVRADLLSKPGSKDASSGRRGRAKDATSYVLARACEGAFGRPPGTGRPTLRHSRAPNVSSATWRTPTSLRRRPRSSGSNPTACISARRCPIAASCPFSAKKPARRCLSRSRDGSEREAGSRRPPAASETAFLREAHPSRSSSTRRSPRWFASPFREQLSGAARSSAEQPHVVEGDRPGRARVEEGEGAQLHPRLRGAGGDDDRRLEGGEAAGVERGRNRRHPA